jgi:pimeloyl-ACP methyl ester carboxylesterase
MSQVRYQYAYLHGFASGPKSKKGVHLRSFLKTYGVDLHLPDLNGLTFSELTYTGALEILTVLDRTLMTEGPFKWRFIGSSMGGYLAARWAELHPDVVDRMILLCPGFNLVDRWPDIFGEEVFEQWEKRGMRMVPDGSGTPTPLHWDFIEDARKHPGEPESFHPTRIIHGLEDDVVPFVGSQTYASSNDLVSLVETVDDHYLMKSLQLIEETVVSFFNLTRV